ncbi:methylated-DNA--[protein]-cysteine S-methyltransferase [Planosporangium flavigriseum]|uniref:Putative methylated-DNA:protein-cysteine methyltransferase n=1 Tax=Planosporangium flavigriseum TaxID=373681 RepID=A0A8J3LUK1_9ACTN|nr:methylated-DNA--[protein]-cysteine S-methyltransferase [Planosporangium flavigriseum]NJC63442.1 methylated-DNA--[protein]-cysteine S-methyltransferase [Planosporangium flavigriseum]GIG76798.1 putative methylated-DNA:protein-cysteine methyltransferase [Planosporangium flavigriseum]
MTWYSSTMDTPAGPFTILLADDETVLASGWTTDIGLLASLVHPALKPESEPQPRADLGPVTKAVLSYLDGDLSAVDEVPVRQRSGAFLEQAWRTLREVRHPVTYTEFAALSGRPAAVRAAAQACARNPAALFVPCHRVLRTDGSLGGFRWGLPVKRWLLDHES